MAGTSDFPGGDDDVCDADEGDDDDDDDDGGGGDGCDADEDGEHDFPGKKEATQELPLQQDLINKSIFSKQVNFLWSRDNSHLTSRCATFSIAADMGIVSSSVDQASLHLQTTNELTGGTDIV